MIYILRLATIRRPEEIEDIDVTKIERYVILMYDRSSSIEEINQSRRYLFTKKNRTSENLPPTLDALKEHLKRAVYQGG